MERVDEGLNSPARLRWERRCLERALAGDRRAFGEIYEAYADAIYGRVLLPRLGSRQAAEDALAETFRTALERLGSFEQGEVSIFFWLSRIAVNKATDMHRVRARTARALASFEGMLAPLRPSSPDPAAGLDARAGGERLQRAVEDVLARLNPRYRRAIELRFLEDKPRQECAEALEVKLGTFDVLLLRALRAFRKEWDEIVGATEREGDLREGVT